MTSELRDRRALVTGGGSGIGWATSALLLERGARVAVLEREGGEPLPGATRVTGDVRQEASVRAAVAEAADALDGPINVLVNAAGIYRIAPLAEITLAEWDEVLDTNLRGTFLVSREVVMAGDGGAIVNLASIAAFVGDAGEPCGHYNASKAGVVALTKQMAIEWAPRGFRVNAVAPGAIDTPMLRMMDDPATGQAWLDAKVPLRRVGRAEEVAAVIAFLVDDAARYVTGATMLVDGGALAT